MTLKRILLAASSVICGAGAALAQPLVKNGDSIAFLGDSITKQGEAKPLGYVTLVIDGLARAGVKATAIPAGISGQSSPHMLGRLERDVISKKPVWMLLSCGVNDAPNGMDNPGVPVPDYEKNITAILDKCQKAGIKVMILTATMIFEDPESVPNKNLVPYNAFLRKIAEARGLPLADLNALMQEAVKSKPNPNRNYLTVDGVHMNERGNVMMATGILTALGLTPQQLAECAEAWSRLPDGCSMPVKLTMSLNERDRFEAFLDSKGQTAEEALNTMVRNTVKDAH